MSKLLESAALIILIVVVALRPLIAESYDSARNPITSAVTDISDPKPIATLSVDLAILVAALLWSIAHARRGTPRVRRTGLEIGLVFLGVASVLSCFHAGNTRLAVNASIDWLCCVVLALVLIQIVREPWQKKLLLATILATAAVQAAQCYEQRFRTFDETWQQYQQTKKEFWARQGVDPTSNRAELFERRMLSRQAPGFMSHSNVAGAYAGLCALTALGAAIAAWRKQRIIAAVALSLLAVFLLGAMLLTKSLGAVLAYAAALALWWAVHLGRDWTARHRRAAFLLGWSAFVVLVLAVVAHGWHHGSLPTSSLAFRWQYWRNSLGMIADHGLSGVGRENFGRHYLQYKPIESAEEISNPHDLLVHAATELGVLGLLGIIALLFGASRVFTKPREAPHVLDVIAAAQQSRSRATRSAYESRWVLMAIGAMVLTLLTLARIPLLGSSDPNYVYYTSMVAAIIWLPVFFCVALLPFDRAIFSGIAFGLFAFLLQDMISFATFVPATATTLFALYACAAAARYDQFEAQDPSWFVHSRWLPIAAACSAIVGVLLFGAVPVRRAARHLETARSLAAAPFTDPSEKSETLHQFLDAAAADPIDPTPLVEAAQWLGASASNSSDAPATLQRAIEVLHTAIDRDPHSHALRRLAAMLYRDRALRTKDEEDYKKAISAAREALKLYPQNPAGLVLFGECQIEAGQANNSVVLVKEGIAALEYALNLDARRPSWSVFQGLTPQERERVAQIMDVTRVESEPRQ